MNATGYRILGYAVWQGGKWYLRRQVPSGRAIVGSALLAGTALGSAVAVARRLAG